MKFQLRPILSEMKLFYQQPLSSNRFEEYLSKLQGNTKGDLILPISGYNPMAKEHILEKIEELEKLDAEGVMENEIEKLNATLDESTPEVITVVLNLADDLKGGWTNRATTDYESKFKINAIVNRNFCAPYFWASESYTLELVRLRSMEYLYRTLFWLQHSEPISLKDHIEQEVFVASSTLVEFNSDDEFQFEFVENYYLEHRDSEEEDLIFNFLYGDIASGKLGYKKFGINDKTGFDYARYLAKKKGANTQS